MRARGSGHDPNSSHDNANANNGNPYAGSYGGSSSTSSSYYGGGGGGGYGSPGYGYGGGGAPAPAPAPIKYSSSSYGGYNAKKTPPSYYEDYSTPIREDNTNGETERSNKYKKSSKNKKHLHPDTASAMIQYAILLTVTTLLALCLTIWYWNMSSQKATLLSNTRVETLDDVILKFNDKQQQYQTAIRKLDTIPKTYTEDQKERLTDLKEFNEQVKRERDELQQIHEGPERKKIEARMRERQRAYQYQVDILTRAARRESKRTVLERFGPGPHKVRFQVAVPTALQETARVPHFYFAIELAPLSAVPHAIHLFLEQIDHGLWNENCFVYLNSNHVLQMGPAVVREEEEKQVNGGEYVRTGLIPFQDAGLDTLSFPDYSDEFPHEEWTVGFAGRPGGPDIYINKVDNTELHGPGGQFQHALEEQGDSCFGRIISGQREIERYLYGIETIQEGDDDYAEGWEGFARVPASILDATILTAKPQPKEGEQVVMVDMDSSTVGGWTAKDDHRFEEDVLGKEPEVYYGGGFY